MIVLGFDQGFDVGEDGGVGVHKREDEFETFGPSDDCVC